MADTTYQIDEYCLRVFSEGLRTSVEWKAKGIALYSQGNLIAIASFARDGYVSPRCAIEEGVILFNAPGYQYQWVVDLLRHEDPVYIKWRSRTDSRIPGDGYAAIYSGREPMG